MISPDTAAPMKLQSSEVAGLSFQRSKLVLLEQIVKNEDRVAKLLDEHSIVNLGLL
jgi:hypothetical protein